MPIGNFNSDRDPKYLSYGQARDRVAAIQTAAANGLDPFADARADHKAEVLAREADERTVSMVFRAWLDNPLRPRALAPRTRAEYQGIFGRHLGNREHSASFIAEMPIGQLSRDKVEATLEAIRKATSDATKGQRGLQATKARSILHSMCKWARLHRWIEVNPVEDTLPPVPKENPRGKQSRPLTDAQLRTLWNGAPTEMTKAQARVLKLTILLGRRISEIAGAVRDDARLDQSTPCLFIPANREGNKAKEDDAVPLPPMALEIIKEALTNGDTSDLLFVGASTRWTTSKAFTQFCRNQQWSDRTRLHDTRSLINDHLAAMSVPSEIRSRILHHTGDLRQLVNTTYSAFDFLPDRLHALTLWENRLIEIVHERKPTGLRWS